jgi:hypothetical protein
MIKEGCFTDEFYFYPSCQVDVEIIFFKSDKTKPTDFFEQPAG